MIPAAAWMDTRLASMPGRVDEKADLTAALVQSGNSAPSRYRARPAGNLFQNPTPRTAIPNTAFTSMCVEVGVGERETPSLPTIQLVERGPLSRQIRSICTGSIVEAGSIPAHVPLNLGRKSIRLFSRLALLLILAYAPSVFADEPRKETKLFRALGWAHLGLQAGDLASTEMFLAEGYQELNPLMQSRAVRFTTKPAVGVVTNYATAKLYQEHPKLAVVLRIGVCVAYGYVVANNFRLAAR
jgi:hypothetical protein